MYCIVSYIAIPAVTDPPGELMYREIGLVLLSASRNRRDATIIDDVGSVTSPFSRMILSLSSRENMSKTRSPFA